MRNDYKKLEKTLETLENAQSDFTRLANQRIGCITGAPSDTGERDALLSAQSQAESIVHKFIANNANLSILRSKVEDWKILTDIIDDEISEREFSKAFRN